MSENTSRVDLEADVSSFKHNDVPLTDPKTTKGSGSAPLGAHNFPEGGARAWLCVVGCWCALFFTFGYMNSFGVYETYYLRHFLSDHSPDSIAWIGSIQACAQFSATVISGPISDRFGPQVVIYPFSFTLVLATMLTSICTKYYQFLLCQGILLGISSGLIYAPAIAVVGHYFHRKRPMVMAIASTGSTLGGIIYPVILTKLLNNPSASFGWAQRAVGFISLALAIVACVTIRPGIPPRKGQWLLPEAFKNPAYYYQVLALFFMGWGLFTPFFYLAAYGLRHGMATGLATYLFAILNGGSFLGRMVGGVLSLKLGQFNIMVFASVAAAILLFSWLRIYSTGGLIVLTTLYGAVSGMIIALMVSTLGQVAPHPSQIGTYIGMASAIVGLAALTGTPITGAMINHYGRYTEAIIFSGVNMMVGAFFFLCARLAYAKGKLVA